MRASAVFIKLNICRRLSAHCGHRGYSKVNQLAIMSDRPEPLLFKSKSLSNSALSKSCAFAVINSVKMNFSWSKPSLGRGPSECACGSDLR
mmetsp:Transcript_28893/g.50658  ORF Transcript_28893/g.50658 Transcript_28893/m.50658 type:complete len:91 (-) Transcript_28893:759-1031(-)